MWLRWSLRDLRSYWVSVVAIALVMAIGVGVFAGLSSTATWRRQSNDASFAMLRMHDLHVELSPGTFADEGSLLRAIEQLSPGRVLAASERLVVTSQIDASRPGDDILSHARLVGMDTAGDAAVDRLWVRDGSAPSADRAGQAVLEAKYVDHWDLPVGATIRVAGGEELRVSGVGMIPEDFFYEGPEGSLIAQGELAPVYLPLAAAQDLVGRPGQVNDLVLSVDPEADRDLVEAELGDAMRALGVSATVTNRDDAVAVRLLYEDIESDQQVWNAIAALILGAAALASFNLINRIVEAQRREIGIGMAIGTARSKLAVRPMLIGLYIAALGLIGGVLVGQLVSTAMRSVLESFLPLPVWRTDFQPGVFAIAAALALAIPLLATAVPVWRAVSVEPIQAIKTGHLAAKTSRVTDWTGRIRMPGSSFTQIPIRNVLRTPRRTILTALGVGAAVAALVGVLGMLDSFRSTIQLAGDELRQSHPDRMLVQLDTFYPEGSTEVRSVMGAASVGRTDTGLRLPVTALARDGDADLELLVELVDLDDAVWTPTLIERAPGSTGAGVILARKAADDLGVGVGETLQWVHPVRAQDGRFTLTVSDVTVDGIHPNPLRAFAFMDLQQAQQFGLEGVVNLVTAYPAATFDRGDVQREVFDLPGVASSQAVARVSEAVDEALEQFSAIIVIVAVAVGVLALLIAFNASRITVDERRREHATMRAFGLPVRTILGIVVKESVIVGALSTTIGIVVGAGLTRWFLRISASTIPDVLLEARLSTATLVTAALVGVVAVAAAPVLLVRRIQRMNIPDTLRVME